MNIISIAYENLLKKNIDLQGLLVVGMLVAMPWVESSASSIYILSLCYGLFSWHKRGGFPPSLVPIALLFLSGFVVVFLSILNADDLYKFFARMERLLRLFFFPIVLLAFLSMRSDPRRGFEIGLLIAALACLPPLTVSYLGIPLAGAYNSILFGDFTAYLTCASLTAFILRAKSDSFKAGLGLSTSIFFICSISSGTRGAWIAIIVTILTLVSVDIFRGIGRNGFNSRIAQNALLIGVMFVMALNSETALLRLDLIGSDLAGFSSGNDVDTSMGLRFQLWKAAYVVWQENPWLGSGLGDFGFDLKLLMEHDPQTISVHFGEAHSIYFEFLATTGLIGLAALLFVGFIYPAVILAKDCFRNSSNTMSIQGLILISSFAIFGLSQNWLARSSISSVYFFLLAFFLANLIRKHSDRPQLRISS